MHDIYARGDRLMKLFILIHFALAMVLATRYQTWMISLGVASAATLMFFASVLLLPGSFFTRCVAGISLQAFVALHIYQMHGLPEMHFFFFTAFTMMIVYQDGQSMWPGAILIIGQHILFAGMVNAGYKGLHFFPDGYIPFEKLVYHFGIALVEVGLCSYWSALLKQRNIESALQRDLLTENQQMLEVEVKNARRANQELEANQAELERLNRQLEELAVTDGLTGLKNHRAFQEKLEEEFDLALRHNLPLSLIMLDVDFFKQFNDRYGHPAGDAGLKLVAEAMQAEIRHTDFLARYGGEEFALILPYTDDAGAHIIAERCRIAIASMMVNGQQMTASLGVASVMRQTGKLQLVAEADHALYVSKQSGRNRVTHYTDCEPREAVA